MNIKVIYGKPQRDYEKKVYGIGYCLIFFKQLAREGRGIVVLKK